MNNQTDECCPKFTPENWDEKTFNWDNKLFIKDAIPTLFHIPLPSMIGKKVTKMYNQVMASEADPPKQEFLLLFRDPTPFRSELYMSTTKEVAGANVNGINMRIRENNKSDLRKLDVGVAVGFGYKLLKGEEFTIGLKYYQGFTNVYKNKTDTRNSSLFLEVNIPIGAKL
jgi:hypothetical protein